MQKFIFILFIQTIHQCFATDLTCGDLKVVYNENCRCAVDSSSSNCLETISRTEWSEQVSKIDANTKSYTGQPTYTINTFNAELGGYVIQISPSGTHGLVVAMQDQGYSSWYVANDLLSDAENHDDNGAKFMDWRLPTKRELNLVYNQKLNIGGFSPINYWSSTEYRYAYAWTQYFANSHQSDVGKGSLYNVRSVRAF